MAKVGKPYTNPHTFGVMYPITVYIPQEIMLELAGAFPLDLREEMVKIIGEEVISAAEMYHSIKKYAEMYPIEAGDEPIHPVLLKMIQDSLGTTIEPIEDNG